MVIKAALLCTLVLQSTLFSQLADLKEERRVCKEVVTKANSRGLDPTLALAVAYVESRFTYTISKSDARGPLQIIPRWCCPGRTAKGCDLVYHGVRVLKEFRARYGSWPEALCHYNAGVHCGSRSKSYAHKVMKYHERIKVMVRDHRQKKPRPKKAKGNE